MTAFDQAFALLKEEEPYHLMSSNALADLAQGGDEEAYEEMERRMDDWYGHEQPEHKETTEWLEEARESALGIEYGIHESPRYEPYPDPPEGMKESRDEHMMQQDYYPPEAMGEMYAEESGKNPWRTFQPISNRPSIRLPIMTPIHRDESGLYGWQNKNASEPMRVFDQSFALLKIDEGMWDEIYAPLRAQTAGMGDLPHAEHTTDFVPTQLAIDSINARFGGKSTHPDGEEVMDWVLDSEGDHGYDIETLMQSIEEEGFLPPKGRGYRPDPTFQFSREGISQYEGNHRLAALQQLGAPYVPYMGFHSRYADDRPHPMPLGEGSVADVMENTNQYSLGGYMGDKSRLMVPPSYLYGREMVPGMGRLLPVDRQGDPLDMHGHIHSDLGPEGQQWYDEQSWKVVHDE